MGLGPDRICEHLRHDPRIHSYVLELDHANAARGIDTNHIGNASLAPASDLSAEQKHISKKSRIVEDESLKGIFVDKWHELAKDRFAALILPEQVHRYEVWTLGQGCMSRPGPSSFGLRSGGRAEVPQFCLPTLARIQNLRQNRLNAYNWAFTHAVWALNGCADHVFIRFGRVPLYLGGPWAARRPIVAKLSSNSHRYAETLIAHVSREPVGYDSSTEATSDLARYYNTLRFHKPPLSPDQIRSLLEAVTELDLEDFDNAEEACNVIVRELPPNEIAREIIQRIDEMEPLEKLALLTAVEQYRRVHARNPLLDEEGKWEEAGLRVR